MYSLPTVSRPGFFSNLPNLMNMYDLLEYNATQSHQPTVSRRGFFKIFLTSVHTTKYKILTKLCLLRSIPNYQVYLQPSPSSPCLFVQPTNLQPTTSFQDGPIMATRHVVSQSVSPFFPPWLQQFKPLPLPPLEMGVPCSGWRSEPLPPFSSALSLMKKTSVDNEFTRPPAQPPIAHL